MAEAACHPKPNGKGRIGCDSDDRTKGAASMRTRARNKAGNRPASDVSGKLSRGADPPRGPASTHHEIELLAYRIHMDRGGQHGYDLDDWLQAEQQLMEGRPAVPNSEDSAH